MLVGVSAGIRNTNHLNTLANITTSRQAARYMVIVTIIK